MRPARRNPQANDPAAPVLHVPIAMTIDWDTNTNLATCPCGWTHRVERDKGRPGSADPLLVRQRVARAQAMDAAIDAHWQGVRDAAGEGEV